MHESPNPRSAEAQDTLPDFTPVPVGRRHDGWTPDRQRAFIVALADSGIVSHAARAVGMSVTSAYQLRKRAGAGDFNIAWDMVLDLARERAFALVEHRFVNGTTYPRFYRGRFVGLAIRDETRIALAVLRAALPEAPRR